MTQLDPRRKNQLWGSDKMKLREYLDGLRGKRVAVLGMGISNEPLVRLLIAHDLDVTVRDRRELPPMDGAKTITGPDYLRDLTEDVVFRTPGLRPDQIPLKPGAVLTLPHFCHYGKRRQDNDDHHPLRTFEGSGEDRMAGREYRPPAPGSG